MTALLAIGGLCFALIQALSYLRARQRRNTPAARFVGAERLSYSAREAIAKEARGWR